MAAVRDVSRTRPRAKATWNAPNWRRKKPACSPARSRSIRSNDERIPIWIADYVLIGYGTGAIMAVPAHDERDLEFARNLICRFAQVVQAAGTEERDWVSSMMASRSIRRSIDGLPPRKPKRKITDWLERKGVGKRPINYKLRDWLFRRQRYWGEPFPIVWEDGNHRSVAGIASCRCCRRRWTITNRPAPANRRWRERKIGFAFRQSDARNEHDAAMGRLVLVLPAILRRAERAAFRGRGSGAILDGRQARRIRESESETVNASKPAVSICMSAEPSTPCCICCMRASGTKFCSISVMSRRRSRFSDSSIKDSSWAKTARRCRSRAGTSSIPTT